MIDEELTGSLDQAVLGAGTHADVPRPYAPLDRPADHGRLRPIAAVLGVCGIVALTSPSSGGPAVGLLIFATAALLLTLERWVPWSRLPVDCQLAIPLILFALVGVTRHLTGGAASVFTPMAIIPVAWIAIFGSRRQLLICIGAVVVTVAAPVLLFGGDVYPVADLRRAVILAATTAGAGLAVNELTANLRRAEARALELSPVNARLDGILRAAATHSIVVCDDEGIITVFSEGAERMLGWKADEVIGRVVTDLFHDPAEIEARSRELGCEPGPRVFGIIPLRDGSETREWTYRCRDGSQRPIELTVTVARDEDAQFTGYVAIATDITEQRQTESRYERLIESLPDTMVMVVGRDRRIIAVAGEYLRRMDPDPDRYLGHFVTEFEEPLADGQTWGPRWDAAFRGEVQRFSWATISGMHYDSEILPTFGPDGEIIEVVSVTRDVTVRQKAVRAVALSEERNRLIVSSLHEGVALFDADGVATDLNAAALDLLGIDAANRPSGSAPSVLGLDCEVVHVDGTTCPPENWPLAVALRTGEPQVACTIGISLPNRTFRWLSITVVPTVHDGRATGAVMSFTDQTERHAAEREVVLARDRFSALIEHSHDLIIVIDAEVNVLYASPAWSDVLGWDDPFEMVAARATSILHPDDAEKVMELYRSVGTRAGATEAVQYRVCHRDGSWHTLDARLTNLLDDPAVRGMVVNAKDITPQIEASAKLTHQALHDALTGLPNRALVQDRIQSALDRQRRSGGFVSVLFLDLDRFKNVNDSLGHAVGDAMLVEVAARLERSLRPGDTVGRLGGDEFVVIAEQLREAVDATLLATRLAEALNEPLDLGGQHLIPKASIGVVTTDGTDRHSPGDLLRDADAAMYQAKQRGRSRFEVFDDGLRQAALDRLVTEQDLRTGLTRHEFVPFFQPQYDLHTGALLGAEALVRWHHPTRGLLPPAAFLEVADTTGLLTPMGWQMLEKACIQGAEWRSRVPEFVMSVNLSIGQLSEPDFATRLDLLLARTGLDPTGLCLELTEYSLLELKGTAARELYRAKALGVTVAVDDFGTGYSNLQLLANVQVDVLKVDRTFVDPLDQPDSDRHRAVVSAVAGLGHALGLSVVAEGVERDAHIATLLELGCDSAQGYLFGRPVPTAEFSLLPAPLLAAPAG